MENKWFSTTKEQTYQYVKDNNLTRRNDGMHTEWLDTEGVVRARSLHGFFSNIYSIFEYPNFETINFISTNFL